MAFVKKTWVDRDSEYPNRRSLTDPTTGTTEIRDIGLAEGDVYAEGDRINAENFNDLEQRIEDAIDAIPITEVEVTPVVTDGETLATIRVNEDTSDIKMPKPYVVKITYASGEYTADKTVAEIYAAAENGYEVYALYGMEMFDLAGYSRSSASFINVTNTASSKTSTIRSFVIRSNNTTTYDSKTVYNLPSISSPSSVGRIMTVSLVGSENRYSLTTDNTIDDAHTNDKRTYSSQKVNAELQARDAEIALKANTADVDTALALKADKADTYTKSQVDTALSTKADTADVTASLALKADKADTYTKTEVDTALGNKADKATTYTKSEVDTALALKADETDLPTKVSDLDNDSDYQTGIQVQSAIEGHSEIDDDTIATDSTWSSDKTFNEIVNLLPTDTASGSVASFTDGANNIPTKQVICHINPTETGIGEKSPSNPYVIGGFTECNVTQTDGQTPPIISKLYTVPFGQTVYGGELVLQEGQNDKLTSLCELFQYNYQSAWQYTDVSGGSFYIQMPRRVKETQYKGNSIAVCNIATFSDYSFVTNGSCLISASKVFHLTLGNALNIHNAADFKTYLQSNNITVIVCAELATPTEINLPTKTVIPTLLGANNIYHDCDGDTDVTYRADIGLYISKKMA